MKKFTKPLVALALLITVLFAMTACTQDETDKRFAAIKESYANAGYTVSSINKSSDLVKGKEGYLTEVEEICSITKPAGTDNTGESYVLFKFKDMSKAEELKTSYGSEPKTAHSERLLLVGLNGTNTLPFTSCYND